MKLNGFMKGFLAAALIAGTFIAGMVTSSYAKADDSASGDVQSLQTEINSLSSQLTAVKADMQDHERINIIDGSLIQWTRSGSTLTGTLKGTLLAAESPDVITKVSVDYDKNIYYYDVTPVYDLDASSGTLKITIENVPEELSELQAKEVLVYSKRYH